jgi:hypothetical protein
VVLDINFVPLKDSVRFQNVFAFRVTDVK